MQGFKLSNGVGQYAFAFLLVVALATPFSGFLTLAHTL